MVLNGDEFLAQLLETFREEAQEHLSAILSGLLTLEKSGITPEEYRNTVETVFRETHSLKGAARAVGLKEIETLCQQQENVFSAVKKGTLTIDPGSFDLFHEVIRVLEKLLAHEKGVKTDDLIRKLRAVITDSGDSSSLQSAVHLSSSAPDVSPIVSTNPATIPPEDNNKKADYEKTPGNTSPASQSSHTPFPVIDGQGVSSSPPKPPLDESGDREIAEHLIRTGGMIKISSERLENLFARSDDLMGARLAAGQRSSSLRDLLQNFMSWRWAWSQITTDLEHLRTGTESGIINHSHKISPETDRIISFLEYNRNFIKLLEEGITSISRAATRDQYLLDTATIELIDEIKQVILTPASSLLDMYPRAVRDIARESGKEVDVLISGAEIEVDRRILESIRDPVLHIIRNSIDHGIESPKEREVTNKSPRGRIQISVSHVRGHKVEISIEDDGRGIHPHEVLASAVAKGLISTDEGERMDSSQILRLIFKSGLSTRKTVSTVSGRGLGLAIALEKVEQIGGTIQVDSTEAGTRFILSVPLTLATFRGVRVQANRHPYYLPLRSIDRVMHLQREDIRTIENRLIVEIDREPIAVAGLAQVLGISAEPGVNEDVRYLVIISASGIRFGLLVDEIAGVQEIVVKDLGKQLRRVRNISGASIQGDGVVIPVINCEDLASTITGMEHIPEPVQGRDGKAVQHRLMVVEDSITSRMLLKNILEGAGYTVETAVDGIDALTKLKVAPIDLVVSDVDMPRMNGFLLTEKIRTDSSLADIPVILVTSLDSREDREHGITVGANAYIVKSSFDQSNLLEVISRHIS